MKQSKSVHLLQQLDPISLQDVQCCKNELIVKTRNTKDSSKYPCVAQCLSFHVMPFETLGAISILKMETRDAIGVQHYNQIQTSDFQNYLEHKLQARWALRHPLS